MKAQISFEYYFSLLTFAILVSYLFLKLITLPPFYSSQITTQQLRSETYQISEILVNSVGYPANWNTFPIPGGVGNIKGLGLSDETRNKTNLVSTAKTTAFDNICKSNGYNKILELLDIRNDTYGFWVLAAKDTSPPQILIECSPLETSAKIRTNITRIIAFNDGTYGELRISLWKR